MLAHGPRQVSSQLKTTLGVRKLTRVVGVIFLGLGILGGLSLLLPGAIDRGYQKYAMRDMLGISSCIEDYRAAHGRFPSTTTTDHLGCDPPAPSKDLWGGPYIIAFEDDAYYVI